MNVKQAILLLHLLQLKVLPLFWFEPKPNTVRVLKATYTGLLASQHPPHLSFHPAFRLLPRDGVVMELRQALVCLALLAASVALSAPNPEPQNEQVYDIILVGAGVSGCIAARRLRDMHPHRKMLLLEAGGPTSKYAGGKMWPQYYMNVPEAQRLTIFDVPGEYTNIAWRRKEFKVSLAVCCLPLRCFGLDVHDGSCRFASCFFYSIVVVAALRCLFSLTKCSVPGACLGFSPLF